MKAGSRPRRIDVLPGLAVAAGRGYSGANSRRVLAGAAVGADRSRIRRVRPGGAVGAGVDGSGTLSSRELAGGAVGADRGLPPPIERAAGAGGAIVVHIVLPCWAISGSFRHCVPCPHKTECVSGHAMRM